MDIIREYVNTYVNGFAQLIVPGTEQANRAEISIVSGTLKVDAFKQMGDNSFTTVYSASLSAPQKTVIRVEHTTYIHISCFATLTRGSGLKTTMASTPISTAAL